MTVFCGLIGTPYVPDCTDCIMFLEDVGINGIEMSMHLNKMDLSGMLDSLAGIVFGQFIDRAERMDEDFALEDVIVRKLGNRLPCIFGMNFSHGSTSAAIPLGVDTVMDAEDCSVSFGNPFE